MSSLELLQSGLMTSIQDMGRTGWAYYAIPRSGVMDSVAARRALLLCRLQATDALLECTMIPPKIQFNDQTQIVLTGADFDWKINDTPIDRNKIITAPAGAILAGTKSSNGLRGYLAIRGIFNLNKVYHSSSTFPPASLGGLNGQYLKKGDCIEWEALPGIHPSSIHVHPVEENIIKIKKGPEFDYLSDLAKFQLSENTYSIHNDSNRMGARLVGEPLDATSYQLATSRPVLPGFIQLPPSGIPIVLLNDGQTTGGYPRIAYLDPDNLDRFNQLAIGESFTFKLNN